MTEPAADMQGAAEVRSTSRAPVIIFAMTGAAGTTGGIASSNLNVLHALSALSQQSGRKLVVLSLLEGDHDRPDFLADDIAFVGFLGNRWKYAIRLATLFRRNSFYVFDHVRLGLPLIPMAFFGFRDFVILAHGSESWKRVRGTSKWLFRRARMCLTNSRYTLLKMRETFAGFEGKSCVLGLPPLPDAVMAESTGSRTAMTLEAVDGRTRALGNRVILLVARMDHAERQKGHKELLTVWSSVLCDCPDAQLVFAGPGNDRGTLKAMAEQLHVTSTVFIPGHLTSGDLQRLYTRCHAFVMPSRQEGFGLVYLEAMNAGKPCVGCRDGGGEEIIDDEVSGLLIGNPFEDEELLQAVRRLLGDEELAVRMGHEGLRRLSMEFTSAHAQQRLRRLLAPVLQCD